MKIWFTADPHFGHKNIIEYCSRPFSDADDMREGLTSRWNAKVAKEDRVYILGDVAFGGYDHAKRCIEQLNGEKYLILGNHDRIFRKGQKALDAGFAWSGEHLQFQLGKYLVDLSHYPYEGDNTDYDRFVERRPKDQGKWLLHGHVHTTWKIKPEKRMVNVGVDVWDWAPVSAEEVENLIKESK